MKELQNKTDEELNRIFIEEVLEFETEEVEGSDGGYFIFLEKISTWPRERRGNETIPVSKTNRRFIASTYFRPTTDRNIAHHGVSKCPGKLYFETVCELVRQRYSEANDFEMSLRAQDYIQSTEREMVIGCIMAVRSQS